MGMQILIFLLFVSAVLVIGAILLFLISVKNEDFDHTDEISLMPLKDEEHAK